MVSDQLSEETVDIKTGPNVIDAPNIAPQQSVKDILVWRDTVHLQVLT